MTIGAFQAFVETKIFKLAPDSCLTILMGDEFTGENVTGNILKVNAIDGIADFVNENAKCVVTIGDYQGVHQLLHVSEKVELNVVVAIKTESGIDANLTSIGRTIDRKYLIAEMGSNGKVKIVPYCPNCTAFQETWPDEYVIWSPEIGFHFEPFDLFRSCCPPLKGKTLKIVWNGTPPGIYW